MTSSDTPVTQLNEDSSRILDAAWMVRPCELYKEEYRDCKMIRSRFHQLFTTGEKRDCTEWEEDYENCMKFRRNESDISALNAIVRHEAKRVTDRVKTVLSNPVWELRSEPPAAWSAPLPQKLLDLQLKRPELPKVRGSKTSDPALEQRLMDEAFKSK